MVLSAGPVVLGRKSAPPNSTAAPRPATLASRTRRRAERTRGFGAGALAVITSTPLFSCSRGIVLLQTVWCSWGPNEHPCAARWGAHPYRVLSGELNFGKAGKLKKTI